MYFNKKGMQISQIELKIEELQENLKKNQTGDLKLRYIELLKQREALYCNASVEEDEIYKAVLPDTDFYSVKSVEDSILKIAGTVDGEQDEYTKSYAPTAQKLEKRFGYFVDDHYLKVLNLLFNQRKKLINIEHHPFLFKLDLSLVERLNSRLKENLTVLHGKVVKSLQSLKPVFSNDDLNVRSKLDISTELPADFPDQSSRMKKLWSYMCNPEFNSLIGSAHERVDGLDDEHIPSLNEFLYLSDSDDPDILDWNHLLSGECGCPYCIPEIASLHGIIHAMHNITDHLNYSIYEVIYATDFTFEITVNAYTKR